MSNEIMQTLNELNKAFYEFKTVNEERLTAIEQKKTDPIVDEKLENLDSEISTLQTKLKKMELKRPDLSVDVENSNLSNEENHEFKSYLLTGIKNQNSNYQQKSSVLLENNNSYRAPTYMTENINNSLNEQSIIRKYAKKIKTTNNFSEIIINTKKPDAGWVDNSLINKNAENNIEFTKIKIPLHEIYARPKTTKSIIEDSASNIEDWIVSSTVDQIANIENYAFLYGSGKNEPNGILNYPLSPNGNFDFDSKTFQSFQTKEQGQFTIESGMDDLINMVCSMKTKYLSKCIWVMPRSVLSLIRKLRDKDGRYLWQPSETAAGNSSLLGYPVEICDDLPMKNSKSSVTSLLFGNFYETYTIVDKDDISIIRDPFSSKPFVEFYVTKKVGGEVTNFESLKVLTFGQMNTKS